MRFAVDFFLAAATLATCGAQFCGRQACSAIPSPAVPRDGGYNESINCTKPTTCCGSSPDEGRFEPESTNITAVDLSALKGHVIPGTDYDGNEYHLEMCAAATPRVGCMRGVLNGSAQYSTLLWRQAQRNEVHSCQELGSYELSNCERLAKRSNPEQPLSPVSGPIYPPALLNASCGQQYIGQWLGDPLQEYNPVQQTEWEATAGWSTNDLDDGPLTFTMANGVVSTTISFVCNPESVVPQEPFVYESNSSASGLGPVKYACSKRETPATPRDPYASGICKEWTPAGQNQGSASATITVYTSLVCAKGGTELREYQKRADRARHHHPSR